MQTIDLAGMLLQGVVNAGIFLFSMIVNTTTSIATTNPGLLVLGAGIIVATLWLRFSPPRRRRRRR